ncbi:Crp/Fnr family transcriptional regulator [Arenibaculum pallidiluteum]|uniref:Crp/Fnr family transcriptional regulator n=1 Tax=Arenibaculum pallidiluteum TaxID=2812559 RepID=UPI002E2DC8C8|nr:Crp/Fnr family transcriptional regulator [Arenibaculum pallidiluteum]
MPESNTQSLERIELLAPLRPEERAVLARQCAWRRYRPDEQIIDHLSDTRDVCFVVDGRVRVVMYSASGREITFDDVDAGGFIGELSAIDEKPRSASVIAISACLVALMPPRVFREMVAGHPQVALTLMRRLAAMVRAATERIMDLSTLGANNRVHAELLRLGKPGLQDDNTAVIAPIPVHADVASRVSTTRETVARVFSDLTRSKILEKRGQNLVIKDYARLESMVEDVRGD